jgi:hypothetical protein
LCFFDERGVEQLACDCNARRTRDTKLARAARHAHAFERSCRSERACCANRVDRRDTRVGQTRPTDFRAWKLRAIDE